MPCTFSLFSREYQVDLVALMAPTVSRATIEAQMEMALDFEYRLANVRKFLKTFLLMKISL